MSASYGSGLSSEVHVPSPSSTPLPMCAPDATPQVKHVSVLVGLGFDLVLEIDSSDPQLGESV